MVMEWYPCESNGCTALMNDQQGFGTCYRCLHSMCMACTGNMIARECEACARVCTHCLGNHNNEPVYCRCLYCDSVYCERCATDQTSDHQAVPPTSAWTDADNAAKYNPGKFYDAAVLRVDRCHACIDPTPCAHCVNISEWHEQEVKRLQLGGCDTEPLTPC